MDAKHVFANHPTGFVGLVGFLGFKYFFTGSASDLLFFAFFAFFAFFIVGPINGQLADERLRENVLRATRVAFVISTVFLFLVGALAAWPSVPREVVVAFVALGWNATLFAYALSLRHFEGK